MNENNINIDDINRLTLDLSVPRIVNVRCVQGDDESRKLIITLTNNGEFFPLDNSVTINYKLRKPDGKFAYNGTITSVIDGRIHITLSKQATACAGVAHAELQLSKNRQTISTMSFNVIVEPSVVSSGDILSEYESDVVDGMIRHLKDFDNPHKTTKEQLGLGNVDNKSSAEIRSEITKSNVTDALGYTPYMPVEIDNKFSALETNIDWKESVPTYKDIASAYPEPEDGWTVNVNDTDYTYRYNGTDWIAISANAIPKSTDSVDGLLSKEDHANFSDSSKKKHTHSNKAVLDGISSDMVAGWNNAVTHVSDSIKHVTSDEKNKLANIPANIVSGVKGNSESAYRKGDVNLTADNIGAFPLTDFDEKAAITELGLEPVTIWANGSEYVIDTNSFIFHYFNTSINGNFIHCQSNSSSNVSGVYITNNTGKDIIVYTKCKSVSNAFIQEGYGNTNGSLPLYQNSGANRVAFQDHRGTGEWVTYARIVPSGFNYYFASASGDIKWIGFKYKVSYAEFSNYIKLPRVTKNVSYQPGNNKFVVEEFSKDSEGLPDTSWYHVLTGQGDDANYNTQLAIGMTTPRIYFRNKNQNNGSAAWTSWLEVLTAQITNGKYVLTRGIDCNGAISTVGSNRIAAGNKIRMWTDNEGGNLEIESPAGVKAQMDVCGNVFRIYIQKTDGSLVFPFNINPNDGYVNIPYLYSSGGLYSKKCASESLLVYKKNNGTDVTYGGLEYFEESGIMYKSANTTINEVYGLNLFSNNNNNIRIWSSGRIYLEAFSTVSSNTYYHYSDQKIKKFNDDIESDRDKLLKLFDLIQIKSYKYKYNNSNKLEIGIVAQELKDILIDLDLDIDKYNILDISYNHMMSRGKDEDDAKYYTEFYTISYNTLYNLSLMKIKQLQNQYNKLESDIELIKKKAGI